MSVNVRVYRVFGSEVEPLRQATEEDLECLFYGPEGGTGWEMEADRMLDLEKSWEAVNYVLVAGDDHQPLAFLASDAVGEEIDYEFTYGPGRLIEPTLVKEIAAALDALPPGTVEARLADTSSMSQVYPFSEGDYGPEDRAWIAETFSELKAFVERAAKLDCGLLVGSS